MRRARAARGIVAGGPGAGRHRAGALQEAARDLGAGALDLAVDEEAALALGFELAELVAVDGEIRRRRADQLARRLAQRPQKQRDDRRGQQREAEPQQHLEAF